ncbi:GNAT family N-acetyltransferase [Shewanella sp. GXUN23E]|uniref:GNAT family N-acetyltransferase n=1 Tax=Shewanella sp. GXUN23E TaxID=3422498 RepID=UPI003D7E1114
MKSPDSFNPQDVSSPLERKEAKISPCQHGNPSAGACFGTDNSVPEIRIPDSARLSFELMEPEVNPVHRQHLWELDQDPEVMRYVTGGKISTMEFIDTVMLPRIACYRNPQRGWGIWQVSLTDSGEFVGWILVRPWGFFSDAPEFHRLELGWRFKRSCWGLGIATEAAQAVVAELIKQPDVTELCAIAEEENLASTRIMTKLGMVFVRKDLVTDPLFEAELVIYAREL